jgi:DNA-binding XRE family transcriptional regulator
MEKLDSAKIARRLIDLRGDRSQQQVADDLGITRAAVGMYETGERIPKDEVKAAIARYYDKTVQEIFLTENVAKRDKTRRIGS